jgi:3-methylcrotonyl-CoA carboxylase alpha subunit
MLRFTPRRSANGVAVLHIRGMATSRAVGFEKILIANRGEIACRIMRTAKRLGVQTVAVYSDADAAAQHVAMADEAVRIGPAAVSDSYLRAEKLIDAALKTGAQAIHPGYGFLSENEGFARMIREAGVKFVGPPERALREMGSKSESKRIMTEAGVPVTPAYYGEDQSLARMTAEADRIGYPLMVKAVKGGGGKGMRAVTRKEDLASALESCAREAKNSFGDSRVLIEKYIGRPRHIEFQVFADSHGNAVHLLERDCSVQRRHQKVLEEAPAPGMSEALRNAMGSAAVRAALATGYEGAGTVEFMLDTESPGYQGMIEGKGLDLADLRSAPFYFMEMNTRLQVEHPVTEMITGVDLVEWQLRVAAGEKLPMTQEAVRSRLRGHALEARVYAENPLNGFLPATGVIRHLAAPAQGPGVRVDTGVRQGDRVSIFYDPMISKLITWGETRSDALRQMAYALGEYQLVGLPNNLDFLKRTVLHPGFVKGGVDTSFLAHHLQECLPPVESANAAPPTVVTVLAALAEALRQQIPVASADSMVQDPWSNRNNARPLLPTGSVIALPFEHGTPAAAAPAAKGKKQAPAPASPTHALVHPAGNVTVGLSPRKQPSFNITVAGKTHTVAGVLSDISEDVRNKSAVQGYRAATTGAAVPGTHAYALSAIVDGVTHKATVVFNQEPNAVEVHVFLATPHEASSHAASPVAFKLSLPQPAFASGAAAGGAASVKTPMPGKVVKVRAPSCFLASQSACSLISFSSAFVPFPSAGARQGRRRGDRGSAPHDPRGNEDGARHQGARGWSAGSSQVQRGRFRRGRQGARHLQGCRGQVEGGAADAGEGEAAAGRGGR